MELLSTILWWAIRIFCVWLVFVVIVYAFFVWSENHRDGKVAKTMDKTMDKIWKIFDASDRLEKKLDQWDQKSKAQEGDLDAIHKFYGFDFRNSNIRSKEYTEILKNLDKAQIKNPYNKVGVKNLRDIVLQKILCEEDVEQYLSAVTPKEADFIRNHRAFERFLQRGNIREAQKVLVSLEKNHTLDINSKLLGIFYYGIGALYESGKDGYEKDINKACMFYMKAALNYSVTDAMLSLGMILITGEAHGVTFKRDYCTANICISKAAKAGNADAKKLLDTYGVGGVILRPIKEGPVTYHFLYGYEFIASAMLIKYLHMMFGITSKAVILQNAFADDYSAKFKSFEQLVSGIDTLYFDYVRQMLDFGIQVLMSYGIDEYDTNALIEASEDLRFSERASSFVYSLEQIDAKAKQMNLDIEYAKATRTRWSGAGYGTTIGSTIAASVKASVAAGVMNAGTSVLYDIGGNIAKSRNNAEIQQMQNNLFSNSHTKLELVEVTRDALSDIGIVVLKILEKHSVVNFYGLEGKVIYQGQDFSKIDDRVLESKISNQRCNNSEYLNALLLEKLRRNPFDNATIMQLCGFATSDGEDATSTLVQFAGDFGFNDLSLGKLPFAVEEFPQ